VLERGLALAPRSARLLVRSADVLRLAADTPDLVGPVTQILGADPLVLGFERLLRAAGEADQIPRRGPTHLRALAFLLPQVAAESLARGHASFEPLIAIGRRALEAKEAVLAGLTLPPDWAPLAGTARDPALYLRSGLEVLERVAAARRAGDAEAGRRAVAEFEALWPEAPLLDPLREAVGR
jgi:hypothetical protein